MDSILTSIKKMLGLDEDYEAFDTDIIIYINGELATLNQLGVGPKEGFSITGKNETWSTFLMPTILASSIESNKIESFLSFVKTFVYLKVRVKFDPPNNSFVLQALKEDAKEYEWRIVTQVERRDLNGQIYSGTD